MKFMGSKMAILECCDCPSDSPSKSKPFRVTLGNDEEEGKIFLWPKEFKEEDSDWLRWGGWLIDMDAELNAYDAFGDSTGLDKVKFATIHAFCPIHAEERLGANIVQKGG